MPARTVASPSPAARVVISVAAPTFKFAPALCVIAPAASSVSAPPLVAMPLIGPTAARLIPLASWYSRRHEYEADAFAAQHVSAGAMVSALVRLYEDNAATLTPDPLHSAFHDSHPPAALRVAYLEGLAAGRA